ncbi:MAG: multiprotein bridging factor aMBF1 [Candidatus Heimdallarchaeota archaeon]
MARCEICGQSSFDLNPIRLEGTFMMACNKCVKYGEPDPIQRVNSSRHKRVLSPKMMRSPKRKNLGDDIYGLVPDFGERIRNVRETKGWTREVLAKKLNVKESYLAKLELKKIRPSEKMAKKIEKMLEIQLISPIETVDITPSKKSLSKMTLGDIARVLGEDSE